MIKITDDKFVWVIVTDESKAKKLFDAGFELYAINEDVEKLIANRLELEACFGMGIQVAIEGGFLPEN